MGAPAARYDGHADWYDATFGPHPEDEELLRSVLPPGRGAVCLDVAELDGGGKILPRNIAVVASVRQS